jgi:hypothetical protein
VDKTQLEKLGHELNDIIVMYKYESDELAEKITQLNQAIAKVAMREAGVTPTDLADENQENSPRIQHYWTLVSHITGKVYMKAANLLSSYEGLDR